MLCGTYRHGPDINEHRSASSTGDPGAEAHLWCLFSSDGAEVRVPVSVKDRERRDLDEVGRTRLLSRLFGRICRPQGRIDVS